MANVDFPRGLWPLRHPSGDIPMNSYVSNAEIFRGDPLTQADTGLVGPAGATDAIIGVAAHYVSGTGLEIQVYDDPLTVFGIQASVANGGAVADTLRGINADTIAGAGSSTTKLSGRELDVNSALAASGQLRIIRLIATPDNSWADNADLEVMINEHMYKATAGI